MAEDSGQESKPEISNPNVVVEKAAPDTPQAQGEAAPAALEPSATPGGYYWGVGRRKSSVARVRIRPGNGRILVNKREVDDYFHEAKDRAAVVAPLELTATVGQFDVWVNARGGGFSGQAGAILLGLSRALAEVSERFEPALRDLAFLTRDSRMKERKKYGQKGARKRFQFSKR